MSDPETRQKQTHWQPSGVGLVENKNFGVVFRAFLRRRPSPPPLLAAGDPAYRAALAQGAHARFHPLIFHPWYAEASCAHYWHLFALVSTCAFAQTPLVKILADELDRNFTVLKQKGDPAPYFMSYEVTSTDSYALVASRGSLETQQHNQARYLDVTIRDGNEKFDNYHLVANENRPRFTVATPIALEDNAAAIRQAVWLATDRVYRGSAQRLIRLKGDEKLRTQAADTSDDFSKEDPQVYFSAPAPLKFNPTEWAARLRKLSAEFSKYPGALDTSVQFETRTVTQTLVSTEGTRLEFGRPFTRMIIVANGKAQDGMDLTTMESFETDDPAKLPKDADILAAVQKAGANLTGLLAAPLSDPYVGPAILSGRAAGVLFHEIFGHRIEGHRQKDESEGQTFTKSINLPVLPDFLSVIFDPTRKQFGDVALNGYYLYDDEGVKARPVTVVDKGILKTFLMSRSPIQGFPNPTATAASLPAMKLCRGNPI